MLTSSQQPTTNAPWEESQEPSLLQLTKASRRHIFHTRCIAEWLQRDNSCPVCKASIPGVMNHDEMPYGGWQQGNMSYEEWDARRRYNYWQYHEPPLLCSIQ